MKQSHILIIAFWAIMGCSSSNQNNPIRQTKESTVNVDVTTMKTHSFNLDELKDTEYVGLIVINKKEKNPYKRFGIDSATECYNCDGCSVLIKSDSVIIINRCGDEITDRLGFAITGTKKKKGQLLFSNENDFECLIRKVNEQSVYSIKFKGLTKHHLTLNYYFTTKNELDKFEINNCDTFQG